MGDVAEAAALAERQRGAIATALVTVPKIVAPSGVVRRDALPLSCAPALACARFHTERSLKARRIVRVPSGEPKFFANWALSRRFSPAPLGRPPGARSARD